LYWDLFLAPVVLLCFDILLYTSLYVILSPLPLYNPPLSSSLDCTFSCGCTTFLSNILFSALFCLWFLSSLTAFFCYSSIVLEELSASANFLLIPLFSPLLNSSIRGYSSYPLSLTIFLNSWTYSLYVLSSCSIVLSYSTFFSSSAVFPNLFLILLNNSSTISAFDSLFDSSSSRLFFYASATFPCT